MLATAVAPQTKVSIQTPSVIVVTGGAGYIGLHIVGLLIKFGFSVVVIDDLSVGKIQNFERLPATAQKHLTFFEGDFADTNLWQLICSRFTVSAVVHLAAKIDAVESISKPDTYLQTNFHKTQTLLEILQKFNIKKLVFASTAAVYGNCQDYPILESAPLAPLNPYGESKLLAEQSIQKWAQDQHNKAIILRFFNAAGKDPELNILPQIQHGLLQQLKAVKDGLKPVFYVYGDDYATPDGTCIRDFVNVRDIARAVIASVHSLSGSDAQTNFEVFNVGSGQGYSIKQILETAQQILAEAGHEKIIFEVAPRRADEVPISVADNSLIKNTLGLDLQFSDLETILRASL